MKKTFAIALLIATLSTPLLAVTLGEKLDAMTESGRRTLTGMLVRQSGAQCPAVQRTFFQGKLEKGVVWNVTCNSRDSYGIVFYDDEANTTRVMKCAELEQLGGAAACFKKF